MFPLPGRPLCGTTLYSRGAYSYCNASHTCIGHQYNVLPGQVIGVDPDISGNAFVACSILDIETGSIIYEDSGTLGDGHDINCLGNTYGRDVKSQGLQ
jgi:hypothetical protein